MKLADRNIFKDLSLNLIDFGLATKWRDANTGKHLKMVKLDYFEGNLYFSSVNQLLVRSTSRRDDLISLFYLLAYLLNHGNMPCMKDAFKLADSVDIRTKFNAVLQAKKTVKLIDMCVERTVPLREFARHVQSLDFESEPNYVKLRSILQANLNEAYTDTK